MSDQSLQGFPQPYLNNLTNPKFEAGTIAELIKLDAYLRAVSSYPGFIKLQSGIRSRDLQQFTSTVVEAMTLSWLSAFGFLREIRPRLPILHGEADFRIEVSGTQVFGEVWQPQVLPSQWIVQGSIAVADQSSEAPKRLRTLMAKGDGQLPNGVVGMWVADIRRTALREAWVDIFRKDMAGRQNVLGAAIYGSPASEGAQLKGPVGDEQNVYWISNEAVHDQWLTEHLLELLRK